ncbi:hypothetical protein [Halovulum dunhuangense]|nr:hypothetical protein [Halovulum dunhuangense]
MFVFIKTGKTASTSVEMYLERWCRPPGARITERTRQHRSRHGIVGARMTGKPSRLGRWLHPWRNHMSATEIRDRLGRDRWGAYAKITSIRNPFDKALSQYLWHTRLPEPRDLHEAAAFRPAFTAHLRAYPGLTDHHTLHVDGAYAPDLTIRYEHLAQDLSDVCARLHLQWEPDRLAVTKRTRDGRLPLDAFYDDEAAAIVRDRYAWIFDRFGYAADPATPLPAPHHDITGAA